MTPMKVRARLQTPNNLKGSPVKCAIAVCLLFGMCCSAAAHPKKTSQRHLAPFLGSSKSTVLISPTGTRILRDPTVQGGLRTEHDEPPPYDDPSKFGGG